MRKKGQVAQFNKRTGGLISYYPTALAAIPLPRTAQGRDFYQASNGRDTLTIRAGDVPKFYKKGRGKYVAAKDEKGLPVYQKPVIPSGIPPRRVFTFMSHQWNWKVQKAKMEGRDIANDRSQLTEEDRTFRFGSSLTEFTGKLDATKGGETATRYQREINRLFYSHIRLHTTSGQRIGFEDFSMAEKFEFWWDLDDPDQIPIFESTVKLRENFIYAFLNPALPLDLNIIYEIGRDVLMHDLYQWQAYRTYQLGKPVFVNWKALEAQFGVSSKSAYQFRSQVREKFHYLNSILYRVRKINNLNEIDPKKGIWLKPHPFDWVTADKISSGKKPYLDRFFSAHHLNSY